RETILNVWTATAPEFYTRGQSENKGIRKQDIVRVQVVRDLLYVASYFRSLITDQFSCVISRQPRDISHLENLVSCEAKQVQRMRTILAESKRPAFDHSLAFTRH